MSSVTCNAAITTMDDLDDDEGGDIEENARESDPPLLNFILPTSPWGGQRHQEVVDRCAEHLSSISEHIRAISEHLSSISAVPALAGQSRTIDQEGVGRKGLKLPCPICKEDIKFSRTHHFATSHFRPRLAAILPPAKPFICPDCGEERRHKMNLWSHYIGRAHKHLDSWLNEYLQAEVKPDWCDPRPPNSRKARKNSTLLLSSNSGPSSPLVTPKKLPFSGPSTPERSSPASKEWFCGLCHGIVSQRRETHYASLHFKEKLKSILPVSMPFICPDCNAEHKHFLNLSTHYFTQHGYLKTWLEEKGIQYKPNQTKPNKPNKPNQTKPNQTEPNQTEENLQPLRVRRTPTV